MQPFILCLAICALAWGQVFGMQRGYECDHQGTVVETTAEHCHRVENAAETTFAACETSTDCCQEENKEPHAPITVELEASAQSLAVTPSPAFVAVLVTEVAPYQWGLFELLAQNELMKVPLDMGNESPPAALQVARCMVILV